MSKKGKKKPDKIEMPDEMLELDVVDLRTALQNAFEPLRKMVRAFEPEPKQEDYALAPDGIKCSYCGFKIIDVSLDRLVILDEGTDHQMVYHDNCWQTVRIAEEEERRDSDEAEQLELNDAMNSAPYDGHNWFRKEEVPYHYELSRAAAKDIDPDSFMGALAAAGTGPFGDYGLVPPPKIDLDKMANLENEVILKDRRITRQRRELRRLNRCYERACLRATQTKSQLDNMTRYANSRTEVIESGLGVEKGLRARLATATQVNEQLRVQLAQVQADRENMKESLRVSEEDYQTERRKSESYAKSNETLRRENTHLLKERDVYVNLLQEEQKRGHWWKRFWGLR